MIRRALLAAAASLTLAGAAQGAFPIIDDSDPNTVTITAGGFEGGFFVNGELLTIDIGKSASITLPDEGHFLVGSSIDLDQTPAGVFTLLFSPTAGSNAVTSGMDVATSSDSGLGTIAVSFGAFTGQTYFLRLPAFGQNDGEQGLALRFLHISVIPEPTGVPAPASLSALRRR